MSEPRGAGPESQGLVEVEGVNAAPAPVDAQPPDEDVRGGGHPERSDQMDDVDSRDELAGPPDQSASTPGQELAVGEG